VKRDFPEKVYKAAYAQANAHGRSQEYQPFWGPVLTVKNGGNNHVSQNVQK